MGRATAAGALVMAVVTAALGACSDGGGELARARIERGGEVRPSAPVGEFSDGHASADGEDTSGVPDLIPPAPDTDDGGSDDSSPSDVPDVPDVADMTDLPDVVDVLDVGDVADDAGPDVSAPGSCRVGEVLGTCVPIGECAAPAQAVEQLCGDDRALRCCVAALDRCSSDGTAGACLDVTACQDEAFEATAGLCPGAASVQCCHPAEPAPRCTDATLPVPAEAPVSASGDPACPSGMARIGNDVCIDRFEASLVRADDPTTPLTPYARPPDAVPIRAVSARFAIPQGHIDADSAARACAAAGKRLCTSDEWLLACRGAEGRTYPYGNTREPGRCNDARRRHPAIEYFGSNEPWVWSSLGHPCISQLPDSLHLTGENAGCVTPEGVYDLMGNLHEWVDDAGGTFRGGFFADTSINGEGCLYRTTAHTRGHHDYSTGFRCCADLLR